MLPSAPQRPFTTSHNRTLAGLSLQIAASRLASRTQPTNMARSGHRAIASNRGKAACSATRCCERNTAVHPACMALAAACMQHAGSKPAWHNTAAAQASGGAPSSSSLQMPLVCNEHTVCPSSRRVQRPNGLMAASSTKLALGGQQGAPSSPHGRHVLLASLHISTAHGNGLSAGVLVCKLWQHAC